MRKVTLIAAALALALISSCSNRGVTEINIATGSKQGAYYQIGLGIKEILESGGAYKVNVVNSKGSIENIRLINEGKAQMAIVQGDTIAKNARIKSMFPMVEEVVHIIARKDSEINGIDDLQGARVCIGEQGSGMAITNRRILEHFMINLTGDKLCSEGFAGSMKQLLEGKADAVMLVTGLGSLGLRNLILSGETKYIYIGSGGPGSMAEGLSDKYPFFKPYVIPVRFFGEYPKKPVFTLSLPATLAVDAEFSDYDVHDITRLLLAGRMGLYRYESSAAYISGNFDRSSLPFPLHEGARSYFDRDMPTFLERYAEVFALVISAAVLVYSLLAGALQLFKRAAKNRIDEYYKKLTVIHNNINDGTPKDKLLELRVQVHELRKKAFAELIDEKLIADESFAIFQTEINLVLTEIGNKLQKREMLGLD